MPQSKWEQYGVEAKLLTIFSRMRRNPSAGRPYLSGYQLAIAFAEQYPLEAKGIDPDIGGAGIGKPNSLAQYLAGQLTKRMKSGQLPQIETAFLSKNNISELRFRTQNGQTIVSSLTDAWDVSLYRLKS